MIILVTGGSGLVGNSIKNMISKNDSECNTWVYLNSKDCDLRDYNKTRSYISNLSPHIIIHLAACVGGLYKNINYKHNLELF